MKTSFPCSKWLKGVRNFPCCPVFVKVRLRPALLQKHEVMLQQPSQQPSTLSPPTLAAEGP